MTPLWDKPLWELLSHHYQINACGSADPRRSLRCNPPALAARRSCRLSFAVLIVLVCPGSSVYVNRLLRLERRVMRNLAADMKKMYITPVYLAPSDGFIDYLYLLCWSGASNNGLLSSFKMVFWGKRKGVILLFCRLFLRPPLSSCYVRCMTHHFVCTVGNITAFSQEKQQHHARTGLQSISGSTLEFQPSLCLRQTSLVLQPH